MPTQNKRGLTKKKERQVCNMLASVLNLQSISEELVHLGDARRNAQVDGAVADLDDKSADNVRVDFVGDLELLALADVLGLGDGGLEAGQRLVVEGLCVTFAASASTAGTDGEWGKGRKTYLGAGDLELDLAAGGAHDGAKLLADALQETQAVVLGERAEEVLDRLAAGAGLLGQLGDNGGLVLGGEGGSGQDLRQLGVLLDNGVEVAEGLGRGIEGRGFGGGSVLIDAMWVSWTVRLGGCGRRAQGSQLVTTRVRQKPIDHAPSSLVACRIPVQRRRCHRGQTQQSGAGYRQWQQQQKTARELRAGSRLAGGQRHGRHGRLVETTWRGSGRKMIC